MHKSTCILYFVPLLYFLFFIILSFCLGFSFPLLFFICVIFFSTFCIGVVEPENKNFFANNCFTQLRLHLLHRCWPEKSRLWGSRGPQLTWSCETGLIGSPDVTPQVSLQTTFPGSSMERGDPQKITTCFLHGLLQYSFYSVTVLKKGTATFTVQNNINHFRWGLHISFLSSSQEY